MSNIVSFPGLNLEFALNPVAFSIGGFEVRWYGVIIAIGLVLALFYGFSLAQKRYGLEENRVINVVIGGIIGAIVGARAYYVAFSWNDYKNNLSEIFNIRGGGLAIYGAIIGALVVGIIMCKINKVEVAPMLDLAALGFLIGQSIGRWGNFVNNEAFGCNTTLPWGMTSETIKWTLALNSASLSKRGIFVDPTLPVHPTFLYESLWCLLGFLVLHIYSKRRKFDGEIFALYLAWYGLGRFFIEGLRTDSLYIPYTTLRVSQMLAGVLVIASVIFLIVTKIKRRLNPYSVKP
ncbi:MAG: prolipoprotein diacylglyceryl transferase, partial [Oscillospiraceae bacterium]|nr:prolipoprotein diacylglyceryl transferase [Oscillospiraceae bacterium]